VSADVSVLLLTYNGLDTLPAVLDALARQECPLTVEVVAVDSGSRDGTVDFLRSRVSRLIEIPQATFNHGLTRNAGIDACQAPLVVLLVQDAVPDSPHWLAELVAPFGDARIAGTYARQRPHDGASAITRRYLAEWMAASPTPRVARLDSREAFDRMAPGDRFLACVFDNVCACVRRSVWAQFPFPATAIAEDLEWARDVLLAGFHLAYVPSAVVAHSHDRSARYELHRTYLVHQRLRTLFGLATIPDTGSLLRAWATSIGAHLRWTTRGPFSGAMLRALPRALALAIAMPLGQYLGARAADTGRELLRPGGV
jgi:rhamnosyltransferase